MSALPSILTISLNRDSRHSHEASADGQEQDPCPQVVPFGLLYGKRLLERRRRAVVVLGVGRRRTWRWLVLGSARGVVVLRWRRLVVVIIIIVVVVVVVVVVASALRRLHLIRLGGWGVLLLVVASAGHGACLLAPRREGDSSEQTWNRQQRLGVRGRKP